jgi:hypothetical protein
MVGARIARSFQSSGKFSLLHPADVGFAACRTHAARLAVSAATAFIDRMKEPDEGWHSRIM